LSCSKNSHSLARSSQCACSIDFAAPTDFALETLARGIGGVKIWAGMKVSAERPRRRGARYAARKLKEFCEKPEFKDRI